MGAHGHDVGLGGLVVGLDGLGVGLMADHGHGRLGGLASGPGARKGVRALDHLAAAMFGGTQRGAQFGPQRTQNGGDVRRRAERGRGEGLRILEGGAPSEALQRLLEEEEAPEGLLASKT